MTHDVRRASYIACFLIVLLRCSIGWQFLYEGLWKLQTLKSPEPWSSEGYLRNAQGPFRDEFRKLVDDPYDLKKLDYKETLASFESWRERFMEHHPDLTEEQSASIDAKFAEITGEQKNPKRKTPTLNSLLISDPIRVSKIDEEHKGTIDHKRIGEIDLYKQMVERYEAMQAKAALDFDYAHMQKVWGELDAKRKELVGPVEELMDELEFYAESQLSIDQLTRGQIPPEPSDLRTVDLTTIWALIILGSLLLLGLFTRLAALGAAGLLLMFYLVVPPWPGVPEAPGPEHSLIVNKNFIEIVACLAFVALPTGRWLGLDAFIRRFILQKKTD